MARFEKGNTFGEGRPRGSRNKSALLFDEIGREGIEATIRMLKRKADEEGSVRAAAVLLARTWPKGRGRRVVLDLPAVENAGDVVQAQAAVIAAMAAGEITPEEANTIADLLEKQRRALETCDLARQIEGGDAETPADPNRAGA
jgi:hypothetical protein